MPEPRGGVCGHCGIVIAPEGEQWVGALSGSRRCALSPTGVHERPAHGGSSKENP